MGELSRGWIAERSGVETSGGVRLNDEAVGFGESGRKGATRLVLYPNEGMNSAKSEESTRR